jgi:hypothetical protein
VHLPTPIVAEVSDKLMSLSALVAWNAMLAVIAWTLAKKSVLLVLAPLFVAMLLAAVSLEELCDPFVGPAVIHELGYGYAALSFLPLLTIVVIVIRTKKSA